MKQNTFDLLNIRQNTPADGKILVYWLGGAGFVFKFSSGRIVCIDPYLSDYVERLVGFRRLSLPPVKANELFTDVLLITHDHADHLDVDSFDEIIKNNPNCKVLSSAVCSKFLRQKHADYQILAVGDNFSEDDIDIRIVDADHGELSPEAIGCVITFAGRKIYYTGDTSYNEKILADNIALNPEIIIPCINGAFGNLDEKQAAILAGQCQSKLAIPCHFWLFAEHGGDPEKFKKHLQNESSETELLLLTPGRGAEI